jgi:hypothetical protein
MADEVVTSSRFAITPERRQALFIALGAGAGVAQTVLLKKFVDGTPPAWLPSMPAALGSFGKPSALAGIAGGIIGVIVGLYVPLDPKLKSIAVAYGGSALVSGLLSGLDMMP